MSKSVIERAADNLRILSLAMVEKAKSGHPGGAMGGADFINVLYSEFLNYDPDNMSWPFRDRFFLDPGHMSPMLYSMLTLLGNFSLEDIQQFRQWESETPGHPELNVLRGIENTSGPLGLGHAMGLGAAITERFLAARFGEWTSHKIYNYISDGGMQEEISQGVGRIAGHLGLANYILFFDSNDIQLSHGTEKVTSEDTARKYEAWGWKVATIDGNDHEAIRKALKQATKEQEKPTLIIGKTVMGKGMRDEHDNSFEGQCSTHGMPVSKAGGSVEKTIINLGGDPDNPFHIFDDVAASYKEIKAKKKECAAKSRDIQAQWSEANSALAQKLNTMLSGNTPHFDFTSIEQNPNSATRSASGAVLAAFAGVIENMIVSSADLSNSDNTNKFLNKVKELQNSDFSGNFLQAGVAELTMATIMNGMALHGGMIPVCSTFFVFSDYMKPAVRLAALMGLPVKYVWTHDSFRVGEDGPTHQPVEHEAQIRLLEKMKNLEGHRSMLVLRPADAHETTVAWKMALENNSSPTALILSRQNIACLPARTADSNRHEDAYEATKGAYIVKDAENNDPEMILVANGSEVSILVAAEKILAEKFGLNVQIVSAISEGLFNEQPEEYRQQVLPINKPIFGITAGLADSLKNLVGPLGKVIGMERFGASAPYTILDEKFGFTPEKVVEEITQYKTEYNYIKKQICSNYLIR